MICIADHVLAPHTRPMPSGASNIEGGGEHVVIYQSNDREGSTFALSPATQRLLKARFGDKFHISPRIFIAYDSKDDFQRIHGPLRDHLVAMLTGLEADAVEAIAPVEFRDPATDLPVVA